MGVSVGLISKCLAGTCCVGVVGCGGGAVNDRGNETALDREVYEASGTGNWSQDPTDSSSVTAGQTVKITGSTTLNDKTGECTIIGNIPKDATAGSITLKIDDQLTALKGGFGITSDTNGQPKTGDKGKKFFDKCRESRTIQESLKARLGIEAKATVKIEVKKESSNNNYKFYETEFSKLHETTVGS